MSTDFSQFIWPISFACTLISENRVLPNSYSLSVGIIPTDSTPGSISMGYKKIKYFVDNYLHNSIFINKESSLLKQLSGIKSNIVLFPSEPYDYFVGSVIFSKFITVSEKYFHIDMLSIDSALGDHIQYNIVDPEECGLDLEGDFWWNKDSTDTTGTSPETGWGDLEEHSWPKFQPRIIKGGRSEN